jgi:hypothetical protein
LVNIAQIIIVAMFDGISQILSHITKPYVYTYFMAFAVAIDCLFYNLLLRCYGCSKCKIINIMAMV